MKNQEQKIFDYLSAHREDIIADIIRLASAESPTSDKAAVDACGKVLASLYRERLGLVSEVIPQTEAGDNLVTEYGSGSRTLLIVGHFDTVHPIGSVSVRREGEILYGPGVIDMKGGDVASIWAVKAIKDLGIAMDKKVLFVNNSDEETGSKCSHDLLLEKAKGACACIVPEPATCPDGKIKPSRKGGGTIKIRCFGRAAHSGNNPRGGVDANIELAHQIIFVKDLSDYDGKGSTFSPNIISGGKVANVVSDYAEAVVDWRMCVPEEIERTKNIFAQRGPVLPEARVEFEILVGHPPLAENERNMAMLKLFQECAADLDMKVEAAPMVGGCSDGNDISDAGIPTIDGVGMVGDFIHNPKEQLFLEHLVPRVAMLASFISRV
ncbi:MAG: M20/M25/M40 family metallo-hydrolase [Fretibacterium sp.]|nr:M20/M25/M40 family metallo-hydrolase [Fretibacterium sp.]